jgi:hypothetical protein
MIEVAQSAAKPAAVDPKLSYIVSQVETDGFSGALRFEPKVYAEIQSATKTELDGSLALYAAHASHVADTKRTLVARIAQLNMCTEETAQVIYSTSFGLYQLMGYNLYANGLHQPISNYLNGVQARVLQDAMFAKFLAGHGLLHTWKEMAADQDLLNHFALHYNGSLAYANRMKAVARAHYGESLT